MQRGAQTVRVSLPSFGGGGSGGFFVAGIKRRERQATIRASADIRRLMLCEPLQQRELLARCTLQLVVRVAKPLDDKRDFRRRAAPPHGESGFGQRLQRLPAFAGVIVLNHVDEAKGGQLAGFFGRQPVGITSMRHQGWPDFLRHRRLVGSPRHAAGLVSAAGTAWARFFVLGFRQRTGAKAVDR